MRTVFVFPTGDRAATIALLDEHSPQQRDPWVLAGALFIDIVDGHTGTLFTDWEPDDVAVLEAGVGHRPGWAVQVDISGRIDGTAEIHQLVGLLLGNGGVVVDDYSSHPWTLSDIQSAAVIDGLRFFDFRAHHALHKES